MKVITKQFTREILASTSFVLLALVTLFAFFDLINQLDDVGKHFGLSTPSSSRRFRFRHASMK